MENRPKSGQEIYGIFDGEVKKCVWWNWVTMHCPGYTDLVTLNIEVSREPGTRLKENDKIEINRKYLFETEQEAIDNNN